MKAFSKIVNILSWIVTIAVALFVAVLMVPRLFGIVPYVVMSGSMEPVIHVGSVVYVDTDNTEPVIGNVITYQMSDGETTVTHRIVSEGSSEGYYVMKGDANEDTDLSEISEDQIIGTVLFTIPCLGYAASLIDNGTITIAGFEFTVGAMVLVFLVIAVNIFSMAITSLANLNDEDEDENEDEDDNEYKNEDEGNEEDSSLYDNSNDYDDQLTEDNDNEDILNNFEEEHDEWY